MRAAQQVLMTLFLIITLAFLAIDSIKSPNASRIHLGLDSTFILTLFVIFNTILALMGKFLIPGFIDKLNKHILFPLLVTSGITFVLVVTLTYETFILNKLNIQVERFLQLTILSSFLLYISYSKLFNFFQKWIYLSPLLLMIVLVFIDAFSFNFFSFLVMEDGLFEFLQFLSFLIAAVFAFKISYIFYKQKNYFYFLPFLLLALGLIFISLEEISWGQRFLNLQTPEIIKENNFQKELTVHNIKPIQSQIHFLYIAIGLYGSLGRIIISKLIPKIFKKVEIFLPPTLLFIYFLSVSIFSFFNQYLVFYYEIFTAEKTGMGKWQEVSELFLALGFLLFTYFTYKKLVEKV
jgi:hypothetical protein